MTRNESRQYTSQTMVYTGLASGYSIESQGEGKVDFFATNIAFDNLINIIKMRTTSEEVALRLFSQNLSLVEWDKEYLSQSSWIELNEIVPDEVKKLVVKEDAEATYQNIIRYKNSSFSNFIYELLNKDNRHYSIEAISKVSVQRIANSDIVELSYEQDDPGMCYQVLYLLNIIFTKNHSRIKENQTDAVVEYFENQMIDAGENLAAAEDKLLLFNQENRIINYYEQTRYIASTKEELSVELQRERMDLIAAKAAIAKLDKTMKEFKTLNLTTQKVLDLRDKLSLLTSKMAMIEVNHGLEQSLPIDESEIYNTFAAHADRVKRELATEVDKLYSIQNSQEGVVTDKVLDDWIANVIIYEEKKARLRILQNRSNEFTATYNRFAPLGATLKRIEREIDVAEKKYLSLLNSLAMAKLKQQNVELSSNVKVMDPPIFPVEPLPSKRMIVVVVAYIAGFMMLLVFVIAMEYLDTTLRSSVAAEKAIGKKVAAVVPLVLPEEETSYYGVVLDKSFDMLAKDLKIKSISLGGKKPLVIQMFSTQKGDGKSFASSHICQHLSKLGHQVLFVNGGVEDSIIFQSNAEEIPISNELLKTGNVCDLLENIESLDGVEPEYLFVEIPPDEYRSYMVDIQNQTDLAYLVVRSNREWSTSDVKYLEQYNRIMEEGDVEIILNGVQMDVMELEVGELPKRRTFLRSFIKRVLKLQFFKKQMIG